MSETLDTISLKELFRFPLRGEQWQNRFLIGSAVTLAGFLIPIIPGIFIWGYALQVMREAIEGKPPRLPEWQDWGRLGADGLRGCLVSLVYLLPGIVVLCGGLILYFASSASMMPTESTLPSDQLTALLPLWMMTNMGILFLSMFLGSLFFILGFIPLPLATAHFVQQDQVGAAFHIREWWAVLRRNRLGYFIAWVVVLGLFYILSFAITLFSYSLVLCCLIPLIASPLSFYLTLLGAALFGQTYRESLAAGTSI